MARWLVSPRLVRAEAASAVYHCYDWATIIIVGDKLFFTNLTLCPTILRVIKGVGLVNAGVDMRQIRQS